MKRFLACLLAVVMLASFAAIAEYEEKVSVTVHTVKTTTAADYYSDELGKYIANKFNFEYEVWPVATDSQDEKVRVWVNSGSMPTLTTWTGFNYSEYVDYASQGLLAALPEGWETDYPNMYAMVKKSGLLEYLEVDGKVYAIPHTSFGLFSDVPVITNHITTFYRRDWAEELGYDFGISVKKSEFKQYLQDCIDNNMSGTDVTYGLIADTAFMTNCFMDTAGVLYDGFTKTEDGMVWSPTQPEVVETIKLMREWYQDGVLYPDYYLLASNEVAEHFRVGKCAATTLSGPITQYSNNSIQMAENGIDPNAWDAVIITDEDDVIRAREAKNYYTVTIFNPAIDEVTLDRMLALTDWLFSKEGVLVCQMGIPGVEWDMDEEGNPYYLPAAMKEDGSVIPQKTRHTSYLIWRQLGMITDDFNFVNPAYKEFKDMSLELYAVKAAGEIIDYNFDYEFHTSEAKDIYSVDVNSALTALVIGDEDIDTAWQKFIDDNAAMWQPLLDELNEAY